MRLQNKIAVVTGASTGIGRAVAVALAKEGVQVKLIARSERDLQETKKLTDLYGRRADVYTVDLANITDINSLIIRLNNQLDQIDILANIAGIWHGPNEVYADKDFATFDQSVIMNTYAVGVLAPALLVHAFIPLMPPNSKIINLSGTFESGAKGWLPYYVSKRAIEDFTVGLAQDLVGQQIQVNCISPSDTATPAYAKYFPQYLAEALAPEEIAAEFVRLCLDKSLITGKVFVMKKGQDTLVKFHA